MSSEQLPQARPLPVKWIACALLFLCAILLIGALSNILNGQYPDADDALRMVQVRDLVAGQSWFDTNQYRIDPIAPVPMHWSRIVDLPLMGLIIVLTPALGQSVAEITASIIVPLATLALFVIIIGRISSRFFDNEVVGLACLACGLLPVLVWQIQPLRIDHHGWQVVAIAVSLAALLSKSPRRGGWLAGIALATGLSISIELLPFIAGYAAVLFLRWVNDFEERWWLVNFMLAIASTCAALFALTRGFADLGTWCDAIGPAHIGFFAVTAFGTWVLTKQKRFRLPLLFFSFLVVAALGIALFAAVAPSCLATPFSALDPLVRDYWYANVSEGLPFWDQNPSIAIPIVLQTVVAIGVAGHLWHSSDGAERKWWAAYTLLFMVSLAGGLLVWRSMAFAGLFAAIPLAWLTSRLLKKARTTNRAVQKAILAILGIFVLMPALPVVLAGTAIAGIQNGDEPKVVGPVNASKCELNQNTELLDDLPPQTIFAPLDIGPQLLLRTQHSVVATGHHRANEAMNDVILAFTSPEAVARRIVQEHDAGLLVVCSDLYEPYLFQTRAPNGLMNDLLTGEVPDWLEPVPQFRDGPLLAWTVKGTRGSERTSSDGSPGM